MICIHNSWKSFIDNSKYYIDMQKFVDETDNICPDKDKVFRFLETDVSHAKCVILGMDPYFQTYEDNGIIKKVATGRSFEVANVEKFTDKYKQVSLSNIFKALWFYKTGRLESIENVRRTIAEIERVKNKNHNPLFKELQKYGIIEKSNTLLDVDINIIHIKKWFDSMEDQGVLFLNASLTTIVGSAGAHTKMWKNFVDEMIKYILVCNNGVQWLIWGQDALDRVSGLVDKKNIIYSNHPASRVNNTFVKDCCFKKVKGIKWF